MATRGQGAFEYILLIGGALVLTIVAIVVLKGTMATGGARVSEEMIRFSCTAVPQFLDEATVAMWQQCTTGVPKGACWNKGSGTDPVAANGMMAISNTGGWTWYKYRDPVNVVLRDDTVLQVNARGSGKFSLLLCNADSCWHSCPTKPCGYDIAVTDQEQIYSFSGSQFVENNKGGPFVSGTQMDEIYIAAVDGAVQVSSVRVCK